MNDQPTSPTVGDLADYLGQFDREDIVTPADLQLFFTHAGQPEDPFEPDDPKLYVLHGGEQPDRIDHLGMFSPGGTDAVIALIIEAALDGALALDIERMINAASDNGYEEIGDTAVREELMGSLPSGSDAQAQMAKAIDTTWFAPDLGMPDEAATRRILVNARTPLI